MLWFFTDHSGLDAAELAVLATVCAENTSHMSPVKRLRGLDLSVASWRD